MKRPLTLILLFVLLWAAGLSTRSITRPDEGRYAEIAREMAVSGDWVVPHLNGIPYFEKPPLQYWATATAIDVLGPTPLAARLWTALLGLLGLAVVWRFGDRLFGHGAGVRATLVLAGSLYYAALGHVNSLDMGVSVWMTLAVCAFLAAQVGDRRWMWLAWVAAAAGFLSKGLMALALPGGTLVLYTLWTRDTSPWKRLEILRGLPLFLLLSVPWFVLAAERHPEFLHFFFIHEHLERFTTTVHRRVEPAWYFLPILLAGLLPWTTLFPASVLRPLRGFRSRVFSPQRFLAIYALFVVAFFSLSGSKLPSYILPAFPAMALLMGRQLMQRTTLPANLPWLSLGWACALAGGAFLLAFPAHLGLSLGMDPDMVAPYQGFSTWILAAAGAMAMGAWLAARWRERALPALAALSLCSLLSVQCLMLGSENLSPFTSSHQLALDHAAEFRDATHIYSIATYDQTLDYYLQRTVVLVAFEDELAFGLSLEPRHALPTLDAFRPVWENDRGALALMEPAMYDALAARGWPMRLISRDSRRVIVARI